VKVANRSAAAATRGKPDARTLEPNRSAMEHLTMQENIQACEAQIAASGAVLGMMDDALGMLPSAEAMAPAIRSVVQSIAADLIRLPVREMSPERKAPAGITRIATDGEKNGRLGWMPGARA
jgi:hypothetical protein